MGHLIIAEHILREEKLDKIIFIPVGQPSHRKNDLLNGEKRIELIRESIEGNPYFEVSDIEVLSNGLNYTYDTLMELKRIYKDAELFEIVGEDSADYLHKWKNYEELIREVKFLVFRREGYRYESTDKNIKVLDTPYIGISATDIRRLVKEGKSIKYLVHHKVEEIIKKEKLFIQEE